MEWCKLYARMPRDVKIRRAGEAAAWLFVVGMCHCAEQETDGFIAVEDLPAFGLTRVKSRVDALVREGLWLEIDGGWQIARWQELQETTDRIQRKREAARKRQAKRRHSVTNGVSHAEVTPTELEVEVEKKIPLTPAEAGGHGSRCAKHKARPKRWCADCQTPPPALEPPCGECGPGRLIDHGDHVTRCPGCHPLRSEAS